MIVCPNCGKENQNHYKFCLGCGSDLPRAEEKEKPRSTPTPPTGIPAVSETSSAPTQEVAADVAEVPTTLPEPEVQTAEDPEPEVEDTPQPEKPESEPPQEYVPEPRPTTPPAESSDTEDSAAVCSSCEAKIQPGFAFCGACGTPVPGAEPPLSAAAPQPAQEEGARLVLIQPDGTEGGHVDIPATEVAVGRDAGGFFESDPFLSPTHAIFHLDGSEVVVKDAGSLNGVFIKIQPNSPVEIRSGDIFRVGQELVLFEEIDRGNTASDGTEKMGSPIEGLWGRVALVVGPGRLSNAFPVGGDGIIIGRERGDILFPEDGYVSGVHLRLYTENNKFYLNDLGSSNGTFFKSSEDVRLGSGSFLLMGQQLFMIVV